MNTLNVVRQIKQKNSTARGPYFYPNSELEKELGWDNRFHLGKLPDYDSHNDNNYISMKMLREQIRQIDNCNKKKKQSSSQEKSVKSSSPFQDNVKNLENFNEELNVVQSMWDDLGVTEDYRTIFSNIAREMEDVSRKQFFDMEITSLMRLSDNLTKLSKEILTREKTISLMKKFDEALNKDNEFSDKILNDVTQCIKNIRIQAINIVNHFMKIREICSYNVLGGKFDLEKINKVYLFDRNYLIKMKFDLEFLKNSSIANYFNFNDEADPFLLSAEEAVENKHVVSINQDMLNSVKQCQFVIMQDLIFYHIQSVKLSSPVKKSPIIKPKSPPKNKINYPLARDTRPRGISPIGGASVTHTSNRPTSFGFYNLNVNKNNQKYNNLFFTKEAAKENNNFTNVNNLKLSADKSKRIQIETKEKEKELGKTQENFKNFQSINGERMKLNALKQKEEVQKGISSKTNQFFDENRLHSTYVENVKGSSPPKVKIEKLPYESKKDKHYNVQESNVVRETLSKQHDSTLKSNEISNVKNEKQIEHREQNPPEDKQDDYIHFETERDANMDIDDNYNFNEVKENPPENENYDNISKIKDVEEYFDHTKLKEDSKINDDDKHKKEPLITDMEEIKSFSDEVKEEVNVEDRINTENNHYEVKEENFEDPHKNESKHHVKIPDHKKAEERVPTKNEEPHKNESVHIKTEDNKKNESNVHIKTEEHKKVEESVHHKTEVPHKIEENIHVKTEESHKTEENIHVKTEEHKKVEESVHHKNGEKPHKTEENIHVKTEEHKKVEESVHHKNEEKPHKTEENIHVKTEEHKKVEESVHHKNEEKPHKTEENIHVKTEESVQLKTDDHKIIESPIKIQEHIKTEENLPLKTEEHIKNETPIKTHENNKTEENLKHESSVHINTNDHKSNEHNSTVHHPRREDHQIKSLQDKSKDKIEQHSEEKIENKIKQNESVQRLDTKENEANKIIEEDPTISIEYYKGSLLDFEHTYSEYVKEIHEEQKKAFRPNKSILSYTKGLNPKILLAKTKERLVGICCVSYDPSHENSLRLFINHITTLLHEKAEIVLTSFKDYIVKNFQFDEIMIEIHYDFINGAFKMNPHLFGILKDKLKFRWSNLENKTSHDRLQKMTIKRGDRTEEEIKDNLMYMYSLRLKNAAVLKIHEDSSGPKKESEIKFRKGEKNINVFPLIYSLVELTEDKYSLENENFRNFNSTKLKNLSKDMMSSSTGEREKVMSLLQGSRLSTDKLNTDLSSDLHSCVLSVLSKFTSTLTATLELDNSHFLYNRIEQSRCESLIDEETSQIFHVIPTGDGVNSLIIAQVNEKFTEKLNQENKNICQIFFDLYPKLENVKNEQKENDVKVIWIPCVNLHEHQTFLNPNIMSDVVIKKDSKDFKMSLLDEFKQLVLLNDKEYSNSFKISPGVEDIIINDTFLISLVNFDILTELNIPSLFLHVVTKDNWVKV